MKKECAGRGGRTNVHLRDAAAQIAVHHQLIIQRHRLEAKRHRGQGECKHAVRPQVTRDRERGACLRLRVAERQAKYKTSLTNPGPSPPPLSWRPDSSTPWQAAVRMHAACARARAPLLWSSRLGVGLD